MLPSASPIFYEVLRKDWGALAVRIMWRFQIGVDPQKLAEVCEKAFPDMKFVTCWSNGSWWLWLKKRVVEMGLLPVGYSSEEIRHFSTKMHVFFLYLEESEAMLFMLRRGRNEKTPKHLLPAQSKIFQAIWKRLRPIDRVAGRVVPMPAEDRPPDFAPRKEARL